MAETTLPRDDHFDEVLRAVERLPMTPPLPPPIPRQHVTPMTEPPPYVVLGVLGVTIRVLAIIEVVIGVVMLLGGMASQESDLIIRAASVTLGSVFVYAFGESIRVLIIVAQNSFRQTAILERPFNGQ
ncbi:MAG: hypothetical protein IAF94_05735 [Pirellulaceae bacterium]|nr:hypothetical protein [Pirellulaceae bacterium]